MRFQEFAVPGKLMLAGEYAVLQPGGLALAFATGQLVQVVAGAAPEPRLHAFDRWFEITAQATGLAQMAWHAGQIAAQRWQLSPEVAVELRVAGQIGGQKVGLGTSAAVTVAMLRAVLAAHGQRRSDAEIAQAARDAHASGQGGGSGYDVTAIAHGGVICYRRQPDRAEPLAWPGELAVAALFTGQAAPTADALARRALLQPFLPQIQQAAEELLVAWRGGAVAPIVAALARCEDASEQAAAAVPGLLTPAVWRAKAHCAEHRVQARTSGAGGGDCVLAVGRPRDVQRAADAWRQAAGAVVAMLPAELAAATQGLGEREQNHEL